MKVILDVLEGKKCKMTHNPLSFVFFHSIYLSSSFFLKMFFDRNLENLTVSNRYIVKPIIPLGSKRGLEAASNCYDSTLLIKDTDISDERDYILLIENEKGSQEGVVQLRVVTPLSTTFLVAILLSILLLIFVISICTLCFMKKGKTGESIRDHEEAKEDAQGI